MRSFSIVLATLGIAVFAPAGLLWAQPQDAGFPQATYASGVGSITDLAWASDGTNSYLFFTQQGGAIRVVRNGTLQGAVVANVTPIVSGGELGLLGLAIDPAFASNRRIFIYVSESASVHKIYRYTTTDSGGVVATTGGRAQMGVDIPSMNVNHDGGGLAFGQDGHLYFGVGNMGNGNNVGGDGVGGELDTLGSKIGRMTASGAPVTTNPYYTADGNDTARDYIFSRGYRNPFGVCFRPGTNEAWILEVGDNWEHIFIATIGSNRGWPTENNTSTTNGKLIPRFAYQRNNGTNWASGGGCLVKGTFYSGSAFPAAYQGNLFFCENNGGKLVRVIPNGTGVIPSGNVSLFVNNVSGIVDVETGPDGALYYASRGNSAIYRLYYGGGTQNIILSPGTLNVNEGSTSTFTARLAIAPAANVTVNVARTSGDTDATVQSGATLTFTTANWNTPQTVTIAAAQDADTVNDGATITASSTGLTSQNVAVTIVDDDTGGAPTVTITGPLNGATVSGTNAEFFGNGTPQGSNTLVRGEFYVDGVLKYSDPYVAATGHFHYGGAHSMWNTTALSNGSHTLRLTVFDNLGQSGSAQITVTVNNSAGSPGLQGDYYSDMTLTNYVMSRVDPTVNYDWGTGSPDTALPANGFSVRWTGLVTPQYSEAYTFYVRSDDGARLWVNGIQLVDQWADQGPTEWSGVITLTAGVAASIVLEYYENGGGALAQFSWSSATQPKGTIPVGAMGNEILTGGPAGGVTPAASGKKRGGGACGLTGLEGLLVLFLASRLRSRRH